MITTINEFRLYLNENLDIQQLLNLPRLKNVYKDINVNYIFKHPFVQKYRTMWNKIKETYTKNKGYKQYGGFFAHTGLEKRIVNLNDIWPGQIGLVEETLVSILNHKELKHSSELPITITLNNAGGILLLIDCHHRVAAEILKGATQMEINVKVEHFV